MPPKTSTFSRQRRLPHLRQPAVDRGLHVLHTHPTLLQPQPHRRKSRIRQRRPTYAKMSHPLPPRSADAARNLLLPILLKWLRGPEQESLRQAYRELVRKSLPVVYGPIAEIFDKPEDAMTLAQRLKRSYDQERATARAEGRQEGRQEGLQEGQQKGRQEGLQEGLEKGQRSLLAKQLRLKFGALDADTERRLTEADLTQLQLWAERILTVKTLAQVWTG